MSAAPRNRRCIQADGPARQRLLNPEAVDYSGDAWTGRDALANYLTKSKLYNGRD